MLLSNTSAASYTKAIQILHDLSDLPLSKFSMHCGFTSFFQYHLTVVRFLDAALISFSPNLLDETERLYLFWSFLPQY